MLWSWCFSAAIVTLTRTACRLEDLRTLKESQMIKALQTNGMFLFPSKGCKYCGNLIIMYCGTLTSVQFFRQWLLFSPYFWIGWECGSLVEGLGFHTWFSLITNPNYVCLSVALLTSSHFRNWSQFTNSKSGKQKRVILVASDYLLIALSWICSLLSSLACYIVPSQPLVCRYSVTSLASRNLCVCVVYLHMGGQADAHMEVRGRGQGPTLTLHYSLQRRVSHWAWR